MDLIKSLLAQIDPAVLYAVVTILVVLTIIAVINKLLKAAITFFIIVIVGLLLLLGSQAAKEGYGLKLDGEQLIITSDSEEFTIDDLDNISEVVITENDENLDIVIKYMAENIEITMPKFMKQTLSDMLTDNEINHVFK